MWLSSLLRSPTKEEQLVPDTTGTTEFPENNDVRLEKETDIMGEFKGIVGIEDDGENFHWNFMDWNDFSIAEDQKEEEGDKKAENSSIHFQEETHCNIIKRENHGFWDDDEKRLSLNLSLNYQEVLEAWSNRGSFMADDYSLMTAHHGYMGEVPVMEEERTRREASVLRYKEKRQSRLFSKKIRYQVRKFNADRRPRLKGRFVKRVPEKVFK
ncbi:unnamed protein product [Ilex paraguariensis]|uniref:CCT domain-containing protein n=1 Tax=Ilex paraguariensis TaxID=185542 RepID=A0ABC8T420_9AQUA